MIFQLHSWMDAHQTLTTDGKSQSVETIKRILSFCRFVGFVLMLD